MTAEQATDSRLKLLALVWADAVTYAGGVVVVMTALSLALTLFSGGGPVRMKTFLFFGGWGLLAYATFRLWPSSPEELESGTTGYGRQDQTRFQSFVASLPPLRWIEIPDRQRFSPPGKLFLGSLCVLLLSFVMETVFGVA